MDEPLDNLDEKDPYDLSAYKKKRKPSKNRGESKEGSDYAEFRPDPKGLSIDSESDYQKFVRRTLSELTNISTDRSKLPFTNEEDIYKILPKGLDVSQFSHLPFKDESKSPTPQTSNIEVSPKLEITDPLSLAGKQLTGPYSEEDQQVIQSRSKVRRTGDVPATSEFADLQIPRYSLPTTPLQKFQQSEQSKLTTPPTLLSFPELPILPTLPPTSETALRKMSTRQERKISRKEFSEKLSKERQDSSETIARYIPPIPDHLTTSFRQLEPTPGITIGQPPKFTPTSTPYLGATQEPISPRTAFTRDALAQAVKSVVGTQESPVLTRGLQQASQVLSPEQIQAQRPLDSMRPGSFSRQEEVTKLRQSFDHDFQKFLSFFADQEMNVSRRPGEPATAYNKDQGQNIPPDVLARAMKQWNDLGEKLERLVDGIGPKEIDTSAIVGKPFMGPPTPPEPPGTEKFPFDFPSDDDDDAGKGKSDNLTDIYIFDQFKSVLARLVDTVSEFQAVALSRGFEQPMSVLNNSLSNNIPAMTELKVSTTLLKTGLERNSSRIAEYIARSELLGENSFQLANSIRSFSTTMGLNATEQGAFVKSVADAAATYKASTEELATSIASFVDKIGLATITGDQTTVEAFKMLESRIGRFLPPGTLEKALAPMLQQDLTAVGAAGFLGVQDERRTIADISGRTTAEQKFEAMLSMFEKGAARGAELGGISGDINLLRSITGSIMGPFGGPEFFLAARQVSQTAAGAVTPEQERQASIADADRALVSLGDRLAEPLGLASQSLLKILEAFPTLSNALIQVFVAGAFAVAIKTLNAILTRVPSLLQTQIGLLSKIAGSSAQTAVKTGLGQTLVSRGEAAYISASAKMSAAGQRLLTLPGQMAASLSRLSMSGAIGGIGGAARSVGMGALGAASMGLSFLGGPLGVAFLALSFLPGIFDAVFGTKENTKEIKDSMKEKGDPVTDSARASLINQAQLISTVSNETVRTSMLINKTDRDDIQAQHAKLQLDRLGDIVQKLTEIKDKRPELPDRLSKSVKDN